MIFRRKVVYGLRCKISSAFTQDIFFGPVGQRSCMGGGGFFLDPLLPPKPLTPPPPPFFPPWPGLDIPQQQTGAPPPQQHPALGHLAGKVSSFQLCKSQDSESSKLLSFLSSSQSAGTTAPNGPAPPTPPCNSHRLGGKPSLGPKSTGNTMRRSIFSLGYTETATVLVLPLSGAISPGRGGGVTSWGQGSIRRVHQLMQCES